MHVIGALLLAGALTALHTAAESADLAAPSDRARVCADAESACEMAAELKRQVSCLADAARSYSVCQHGCAEGGWTKMASCASACSVDYSARIDKCVKSSPEESDPEELAATDRGSTRETRKKL